MVPLTLLCLSQDNPAMGTLQRKSINSIPGIMAELGYQTASVVVGLL